MKNFFGCPFRVPYIESSLYTDILINSSKTKIVSLILWPWSIFTCIVNLKTTGKALGPLNKNWKHFAQLAMLS